jgi:hypothetical protein
MAKFKTKREEEVYMTAFKASEAKTVKERMAAGDKALEEFRNSSKQSAGSVRSLIKERHKKMKDET